jgi:hypothetical protein
VDPSEAGQSSEAPGVAEAAGGDAAGVDAAPEEAGTEARPRVGVQAHW